MGKRRREEAAQSTRDHWNANLSFSDGLHHLRVDVFELSGEDGPQSIQGQSGPDRVHDQLLYLTLKKGRWVR